MYKEVIITRETMVCLVEMLTEYQVSPDLTLVHMHYLLWGRSWASRPPCWSVGRDPPGTHWPWRRTVQTGLLCQSRSCPQCCRSPACPLSGLCSSWLFPSLSYRFSGWFIIIRGFNFTMLSTRIFLQTFFYIEYCHFIDVTFIFL